MNTLKRQRVWHEHGPAPLGLLLVAPLVALFAVLLVWPLVDLIRVSVQGLSLSAYRNFFNSPGDVLALERTFLLSGLVTCVAILIGGFLAWEMRTASPIRRAILMAAVVFPLWTSLIVRIYALTIILERHGIISNALVSTGIRSQPLDILYTRTAVVVGMIYTILPYTTLPIYASFVNIDLELVRAAKSLGASGLTAFRTVVAPLAVPAVLASAALSFVICIGFYVTPVLLGGAQAPFIANRVANDVFVEFNLPDATAAGTILLAVALVVIALTWRLVGFDRIRRAVAP